jgi:hypothetical protein
LLSKYHTRRQQFSETPGKPKKAAVDFLLRFSAALAQRKLQNNNFMTQKNSFLLLRRQTRSVGIEDRNEKNCFVRDGAGVGFRIGFRGRSAGKGIEGAGAGV